MSCSLPLQCLRRRAGWYCSSLRTTRRWSESPGNGRGPPMENWRASNSCTAAMPRTRCRNAGLMERSTPLLQDSSVRRPAPTLLLEPHSPPIRRVLAPRPTTPATVWEDRSGVGRRPYWESIIVLKPSCFPLRAHWYGLSLIIVEHKFPALFVGIPLLFEHR